VPAPMRDETEAVACGFGRADAPARHGGTRPFHPGRPKQEKRHTRTSRRQLQSLTCFEIDSATDGTCHSRRHAGAQRLLDGPESLPLVPRLHQDYAGRVEPERIESVPVRTAVVGQRPARGNEQDRPALRHASEKGHDETKGRSRIPGRRRHDFMHRLQRQTTLGQIPVEGGQAEGKDTPLRPQAFQPGDQKPQIIQAFRVILLGISHPLTLEQNRNIEKRRRRYLKS
jgi:hypothetical protein